MSKTTLATLGPELVLSIVDRLTSLRDLNRFVLTCHRFHDQLERVLYQIAARTDLELLPWLCDQGGCKAASVAKLLAAGADPYFQQVKQNDYRYHLVTHDESFLRNNWRTFTAQVSVRAERSREIASGHAKPEEHEISELRCRRKPIWAVPGFRTTAEFQEHGLGQDVYHIAWSPIHLAAQTGDVGVLKALLEHDRRCGGNLIDSLSSGYCSVLETDPMHLQRRHRIPEESSQLIRASDPSFQRGVWTLHTPLRIAIVAEEEDAAIFLIDQGADLHFTSQLHDGKSEYDHALHVAAYHGCNRVIKHLVGTHRADIDIDIHDSNNWTPLCNAIVSRSSADTVSLLLDLGADPNFPLDRHSGDGRNDGFSHLHLACWHQQWHHAATLLRAGADAEVIYTPSLAELPPNTPPDSNLGPFRAIDITCMETLPSMMPPRHARKAKDTIENERRLSCRTKLIRSLIQTYGASTATCPGARVSLVSIAATYPTDGLQLLCAMRDAGGVYLHADERLIVSALTVPSPLHLGRVGEHVASDVAQVVQWLIKHGARVGAGRESQMGVERAVWGLVDLEKMQRVKGWFGNGYDDGSGSMGFMERLLHALVVKAGLCADVPSSRRGPGEDEQGCSLFRALARDQDVILARELSSALGRAGARVPDVFTVYSDWLRVLPNMEQWEVDEYHKNRQAEWEGDSARTGSAATGNPESLEIHGNTNQGGVTADIDKMLRDKMQQRIFDALSLIQQTTNFIGIPRPTVEEINDKLLCGIARDDSLETDAAPIVMTTTDAIRARRKAAEYLWAFFEDRRTGKVALDDESFKLVRHMRSWKLAAGAEPSKPLQEFVYRARVLLNTTIHDE